MPALAPTLAASPALVAAPRPAAKDPASEVLPGGAGRGGGYYPGPRVLPRAIDDVTRAFGPGLYEDMLLSPAIAGSFAKTISTVLSGRVHVVPTDQRVPGRPDTPEAVMAETVAENNRQNLDRLEAPIEEVLREMAYAACFGNKLAEIVRVKGMVDGKHALRKIAPKPWWAWQFGVDAVGNVLGYLPPAGMYGVADAAGGTLDGQVLLDPRDFALLTWDARDGGPHGSSILRPCYPWWSEMRQATGDFRRFVQRFASPKPVGRFLPPAGDNMQALSGSAGISSSYGAADILEIDPTTRRRTGNTITAAEAMMDIVAAWDNNGAAVLPDGGIIDLMEPAGDGAAFERFFTWCNTQIVTAILTSPRAIMESEHGSRADSKTADSGVSSLAAMMGRWLGRWLRGVFYRLNVDNFGEAAARRYTPEFAIGDESAEDRTKLMLALAPIDYKLHSSQMAAVDAMIDVPVRPDDWQAQDQKKAAEAAALVAPPAETPPPAADGKPAA